MSKQINISRKIALESPDRKLSVFERLGTKSSASSLEKNVCRSWAQNGTCSLNKTCKYAHTHVLITSSKHSKAEAMKKQSIVVQKRTGKEEHKKSSRAHHCTEAEWEGWELGDLEDADEKALERRKQELQRELQLQLKKEKELTRKKEKRSDKKRASSSSSSSTTSTASSSSTTSSSTSSSEPRKRQNRKRKHGSTSSDSDISSHRPAKSPRTLKVKVSSSKKIVDKKESKNSSDTRNKNIVVTKKSSVQKKSTSPSWEKSRARTPHSKQQSSKKGSPHRSPSDSKNVSSSPRYDRSVTKCKTRTSPKLKSKESSPKRAVKKVKESSSHAKDKMRSSPIKSRSSPSRAHKVSPSRSRRHEDSEKRRSHYDARKSPRRERSREKERKREARRGHSNENENGGLKKGGKILPLKPSSYNKDNTVKPKETSRRKSAEKATDSKSKDLECEKEKIRTDKERSDKDKSKSEREKLKHKKGSESHDRHSARDRESDRNALRGRDDRGRDREAERLRLAKEREAERQKERDEALERCRERQRERERLEKERKEKEDKKHMRDAADMKKDGDRELPSLLDLKTENPRSHSDSCNSSKNSDKHSQRDCRRNIDKASDKSLNQDRDGRDRERLSLRSQGSPADKDHDRREPRRIDDNERRLSDKDYDARRNRDSDVRHVSDIRRPGALGRRPLDDPDCRRPWDDIRRVIDGPHERRRLLEVGLDDRRPHPLLRRAVEDSYDYRRGRDDPDLDVRDFPADDRRARKLLHGFHHNGQDWDPKAPDLEYRDADLRDEWSHADRLHDWPMRYDHKWLDREDSRDGLWNHYSRRPPHDDWKSDWVPEEQPRPLYRESNEDKHEMLNEGFPDHNGRRHNEVEAPSHAEVNKEQQPSTQAEPSAQKWEKNPNKAEGDALSDISDDPDDILNQEDEINQDGATVATSSTTSAVTAVTTTTTATVNEAASTENVSAPSNDANNNQSNNANGTSSNNNVQKSNQQIYVQNSEFFFDQSRPLLECFGERALDFEEISDEELEEEARAGRGIMDVLGADWAGLIKDVRPRTKRAEGPVVAHRRWMIDRLISRIGISVKYAGREFTEELLSKYKDTKQGVKGIKDEESKVDVTTGDTREVKQELEESVETKVEESMDEGMKKEPKEEENISVNITVKLEPEETGTCESFADEKMEMGITLYHDVPALHYSIRECKNYRSSLFAAHNRFKRALSARTDLSLRRELCNLQPKEPLHFASPLDNKLYENSIKLFQRA